MLRMTAHSALYLFLAAALSPAWAGPGWELLGERKVKFSAEKDTIVVTASEGRFKHLKFKVHRNGVNFIDAKVHFANGDVQDVKLRSVVRPGRYSRVIDLEGGERAIDKIVFIYDAQTRRQHKGARVEVYGRH